MTPFLRGLVLGVFLGAPLGMLLLGLLASAGKTSREFEEKKSIIVPSVRKRLPRQEPRE